MPDMQAGPKSMSEISRLTSVFFDPKPVFADLAAKPRWIVPVVIMIILGVAYLTAFSRRVGWESFMRQQIQTSERMQQLPAEQQERVIEQQIKFAPIMGYAGVVLGVPVMLLAIAGVLLGLFKMSASAELTFKQAFSLTAYANMPSTLVSILSLVVMFVKEPEDFDLQNPLAANLGAFLDPDTTSKVVQSLAASVDVFTLWIVILLATAFSTAIRRMTFGAALARVIPAWVVWVVVKAGWAAMFG